MKSPGGRFAAEPTNDLDHRIRRELVSVLTGAGSVPESAAGEAWSLLPATRTLARFRELGFKDRQLGVTRGRLVGTSFDLSMVLRT
jgi:hypothetical protein